MHTKFKQTLSAEGGAMWSGNWENSAALGARY